jgi:acyl transferase domain-containing protein
MPVPIAVIGIGCRFPGATSPDQLWQLLFDGREEITVVPQDERRTGHAAAQGMLPHGNEFDAGFFRIRPAEAAAMDPQHRVLLECAWEAIEDSGYDPRRLAGPVGVFAGAHHNGLGGEQNAPDYLASRVSFKLDLTGPSLAVQTACSTSLVAIHLACQALLAGECRTALAGGVTVRAGQPLDVHEPGGIYSADGHCRAFDADADGTGVGEGVGLVVLKRLSDALADGDTVRAVVLGSAVGNDGANRVGFTAPGAAGQAAIVRAALDRAGVPADTIGYVEAHGSGTPIGDRIEIEALRRAFGDTAGTCLVGSVKTNLGHTHAAAGVAGFIKAVLALQHNTIPASLNFSRPNPMIDFAASPFRVASARTPWPRGAEPRRAGVSSFGQGGTGAHVVLQEAPATSETVATSGPRVLALSARSPAALAAARVRLAAHLADHPELRLADVAHTLRTGRRVFTHRFAAMASSLDEAIAALRGTDTAAPAEVSAWLAGETAELESEQDSMARRVPLPTYPFQRELFPASSDSSPSV